jgi:hypothetical protein
MIMDDGKSTEMEPDRPGDEYIIRRYPHPDQQTTRRFGTPPELVQHIRRLPVGTGWEILHVRDGGRSVVARYWPMTVIDCAG